MRIPERSPSGGARFKLWVKRVLSFGRLQAMLHPAPQIVFRYRPYLPEDRKKLVQIYDKNAPRSFPLAHRPDFLNFLDDSGPSMFVAERECGEIVACGGLNMIGPHVHLLCYGMVAPKYQGLGIGRTSTLIRSVAACRGPAPHFGFACGLKHSFGFLQRFGFRQVAAWRCPDGEEHPIGSCFFPEPVMLKLKTILQHRGHGLIPEDHQLMESDMLQASIAGGTGCWWAQIHLRKDLETNHSRRITNP